MGSCLSSGIKSYFCLGSCLGTGITSYFFLGTGINGYFCRGSCLGTGSRVVSTWDLVFRYWHKGFMVFNTTFNNISVISRQSDLLVEETGVQRKQLTCRKSLTNVITSVLIINVCLFFIYCICMFIFCVITIYCICIVS